MPTSTTKATMDPWLETQNSASSELTAEKPEETSDVSNSVDEGMVENGVTREEVSASGFDNNFKPFVQLPDSPEYLERLENKLQKLQGGPPGSVKKQVTSHEMLTSLEQTRESYMMRLLRDNVAPAVTDNDEAADAHDELSVNPILKKIAPEKQAIALEELVHLIKADQLAAVLESENGPDNTGPSDTEIAEPKEPHSKT